MIKSDLQPDTHLHGWNLVDTSMGDLQDPKMEVVYPIGSMYGIYANIWGILMVNVSIYSIHGSYGYYIRPNFGGISEVYPLT